MHVTYKKIKRSFSDKEIEAGRHLRNWFFHHADSPSIRDLMRAMGYRSPRSAALIVNALLKKRFLRKDRNGNLKLVDSIRDEQVETIDVPLLGQISCGTPILASENIEAMIPVSKAIARPPHKYYLLRTKGDSMDEKGITNGNLVLVRHQSTAVNGDIVVALIDDEATIKEFSRSGELIILRPRSSNKKHQPIVMTRDFQIQGVVVTPISAL